MQSEINQIEGNGWMLLWLEGEPCQPDVALKIFDLLVSGIDTKETKIFQGTLHGKPAVYAICKKR